MTPVPLVLFLPVFADVDWGTVLTAATTAVVTVGGMAGAGVAWLLTYVSKARDAQRAHETAMAAKFEGMIGRVEIIQDKFQESLTDLSRDNRAETRKMVQVVLDLQKETVTAMGAMGQKIVQLGTTLTALQDTIKEYRTELTDIRTRLPPAQGR